MTALTLRHTTVYRYRRPVRLGPHRLMLRPRDSHDLRLIEADFLFSPPGVVRWMHDVFGNSVAIVEFADPAAELRIESRLRLERFTVGQPNFELDAQATTYPFAYPPQDQADLGSLNARHYPDPADRLGRWARGFIAGKPTGTMALLGDLNAGVRACFSYQSRDQEGCQTPLETLDRGWGTCRDFALFLVEAVRSLGFGARIATGYLYRQTGDAGPGRMALGTAVQGVGATHAWAEVYLPGAGWVAFDPTNGTVDSSDLIRVAVTRDIGQAVPVSGSFVGATDDFLGLTVDVAIAADLPEKEITPSRLISLA